MIKVVFYYIYTEMGESKGASFFVMLIWCHHAQILCFTAWFCSQKCEM